MQNASFQTSTVVASKAALEAMHCFDGVVLWLYVSPIDFERPFTPYPWNSEAGKKSTHSAKNKVLGRHDFVFTNV
jgi:hypothetical protein